MLGSIILSTLLLTQSASSSSSSNETKEICPAGAFGANGECYFYSNREMNWYEAVEVINVFIVFVYSFNNCSTHVSASIKTGLLFQFCWGYSGYLVEIEDHTEDRALDEFLGKFDCFWIGLHDEAVEGLYLVGRMTENYTPKT